MPKPSSTEDALAKLREIRDAPEAHDFQRELAPFLRHKSNHVIAAAATAIRKTEYTQLTGELIAAFDEIFPKAPARDPGCKALVAIAEALVTQGEDAADVYLKGIHHVQMEGSFGPPIDVASPLRALCARGLVRMRHPQALFLTVDTLADKEIPARIGAVQALMDSNGPEAELLLRLKILTGDKEGEVVGACFSALIAIAPERSLAFVAAFLRGSQEAKAEAAALALGESRRAAALPYLTQAWSDHRSPYLRRVILLGIAMLRQPEGVEFLFTRLRQDPSSAVPYIREALVLYQNDTAVSATVAGILKSRKLD